MGSPFFFGIAIHQIHRCLDLVPMDTSIALPLGLQFVHLEHLPQARILLVSKMAGQNQTWFDVLY
jgi:hypothetical protein